MEQRVHARRAAAASLLRDSWPWALCVAAALAALRMPRLGLAASWPGLEAGEWLVLACGALGIVRNLRTAHETAARLGWQQSHDALTGLLNRAEFEQRLTRCLGRPAHALLFADIDQFRVINQTCGHDAGDAMLRRVAALLQQSLREADLVARLGADEFAVLLAECPAGEALRVADQLRVELASSRFVHGSRAFAMAASIGVVELGAGWRAASAALDAAEAACGLAKEHGRNRTQLHRPGDAELALRDGLLQWVARIQEALDQGRLCLYAQPIAPAQPGSDDSRHVELLLRMLDDQGRILSPAQFLPAAERFGMMTPIDRWVVGAAFERLARAAPHAPALCCINLSAASLCDERFAEFVLGERERLGVQASRVCFEITETAVMSQFHKALRCIELLREQGFRFALDDFGTGMSSFAYLKRLPVDFLKIDGSFVKDMLHDPVAFAMVEAIHHIGQVMGIRTVAEFVEHDDARRSLGAIGVDYVQGYGIGRPAPF